MTVVVPYGSPRATCAGLLVLALPVGTRPGVLG
jgi:hypothetical protein